MLRVAMNYPGHGKYTSTGWRYQACEQEVREDQEHLAYFEGYSDCRTGKDLTKENKRALTHLLSRLLPDRPFTNLYICT